jgi:hypothetical protein
MLQYKGDIYTKIQKERERERQEGEENKRQKKR